MSKPMSAPMLIQCLAGELYAHPEMLVELIKEEESVLAIVRAYGRGEETYQNVLEAVSAIC